jgi:hypothetical protein
MAKLYLLWNKFPCNKKVFSGIVCGRPVILKKGCGQNPKSSFTSWTKTCNVTHAPRTPRNIPKEQRSQIVYLFGQFAVGITVEILELISPL